MRPWVRRPPPFLWGDVATSVSQLSGDAVRFRRRWRDDQGGPLAKPWRNLGGPGTVAAAWMSGRSGCAARSRSGAPAEHSSRAPRSPGTAASGVPRVAPGALLPAARADRRAVAREPAGRGRLGAQRAAVQAAPRARAGVLGGRSELRFDPGAPVETDVERAAVAVSRAEAAVTRKRFGEAAAAAREALATDLQTFLPDCDGLWVTERRHECEALRLRALEALAAAGVGLGGHELGAAEAAAKAAVAAAPFRESAHRALMEVHEAAGNPAEALRAFEHLRVLLRDELGTTPGAAAMAIHQRLLRGEPAPVTARRAGRGRHVAGAARDRRRAARARQPRRRARVPGELLGAGPRRHPPARDAGRGRRHREDPGGGRAVAARARGGRRRPLRALRRGDAGALPAGRGDGAGLGGGRAAGAAGRAAGRPRVRAGDPAPGAGSAARRRDGRRHRRRRAAAALLRRGGRPARRRGRARLPRSWCSTTSTGRAARRCSCSATSCAPRCPRAPCSSAPIARPSWPAGTRCRSSSATCAARGPSSGSSSKGWGRPTSAC